MFHEARGKTLRRMGRNEEAVAAFTKALEIHPEMIDARLILGIVCVNTGDTAAAEQAFREVIRRAPAMHKGYAYLANLMRQENRPDEELEVLEAMFEQAAPPEQETLAFRQEIQRLKQKLGQK
jgi:cytochrome c-type biogenesis protein CcmH/NrfG